MADTTVLDHRLVRLDLPPDAARGPVAETLAKVVNLAVRMCEAHGIGLVALEEGLGKLRSGGRTKRKNQRLNAWDRPTLKGMLERRIGLRGGEVPSVWSCYGTTIGNVAVDLPDACAAAAEIGRRGLAGKDWRLRVRAMRRDGSLPKDGVNKDLLPFPCPEVFPSLSKDSDVPSADVLARLHQAGTWQLVHRTINAAKLGVRRPHPGSTPGSDGRSPPAVPGFAVSRLGHRRRPGLVLRALPAGRPAYPGRAAATDNRKKGLSPCSFR